MLLLRKEVIQPQVPLRLPCYDFIPITSHTFGACLLAVNTATSGTTGFHDVTGGVYKRSEEHTSELQSHSDLVCRLLLEKKKKKKKKKLRWTVRNTIRARR